MHFDKLSASGALYKTKNYPFLLSHSAKLRGPLSKALLSAAGGHEWIILEVSFIVFPQGSVQLGDESFGHLTG